MVSTSTQNTVITTTIETDLNVHPLEGIVPDSEINKSSVIEQNSVAVAPQNTPTQPQVNSAPQVAVPVQNVAPQDDLSMFLSALEANASHLVTNTQKNAGKYASLVDELTKPKDDDFEVNENEVPSLNTGNEFSILTQEIEVNQVGEDLQLIRDVRVYLDSIEVYVENCKEDTQSHKVTTESQIQKISSVINDIKTGAHAVVDEDGQEVAPSEDIKSAASKLPSFDENGNVVFNNLSTTVNPAVQTQTVQNQVEQNQAAPSTDDVPPFDVDAPTNNAASQDNTAVTPTVNAVPNNGEPFSLEVQDPNKDPSLLSPDEFLAKAQQEALAQAQAQLEFDQKLKEQAQALNQKLHAQDVNNITSNIEAQANGEIKAQNDFVDNSAVSATVGIQNTVATPTAANAQSTVNTTTQGFDEIKFVLGNEVASQEKTTNLSDAIANTLATHTAPNTIPVIKVKTYSSSLDSAIDNAMHGHFGQNHNVVETERQKDQGINTAPVNTLNNNLQTQVPAQPQATVQSSNIAPQATVVANNQVTPQVTATDTAVANAQDLNSEDKVHTFEATVETSHVPGRIIEAKPQIGFGDRKPMPEDPAQVSDDPYADQGLDAVENEIADEEADLDEIEQSQFVKGSQLDFDSRENETDNVPATGLEDGNPNKLNEKTRELIEEEQQFENRRLGRKLEPRDYYYRVKESDAWYQTIINAGYTSGPVFSSLCYSNRIISPDNPNQWTLEMSTDFEMLMQAPDFHHNLVTKFSIWNGSPVEIRLIPVTGLPRSCPEDLARGFYLRSFDEAKRELAANKSIRTLLEHLDEDIRTININLYTQEGVAERSQV